MLGIVLGTGDARRNKLSSFPKVPDRESKEMEKWTEKCKKIYIEKCNAAMVFMSRAMEVNITNF